VTAANFPASLAFTLTQEGGWSDDPGDPGGATLNGITLQTLRDYRGDQTASADDLRAMLPAERNAIYRACYWDMVRGDSLPAGADCMVFDFGVNAGPGRSAKMLQTALGVTADGVIGPVTLAACSAADPSDLIEKLRQARLIYYEGLPGWLEFGRGWAARVAACAEAAVGML
jgi:lysozyme family protein